MWQVLVAAAAAAGSGILAKKFISPNHTETKIPNSDCNEIHLESAETKSDDTFAEISTREKRETPGDDAGIFRFSCPETESKEVRRNSRNGFGWLKKNGGSKMRRKKGAAESGRKEVVADQVGNGSGKKVSICLKKRRTGKHVAGKCESRVSKDNSFGWGVGVGIMYMMSAGTAEISKLNSAMDETVKTVQELKSEILRRKNSQIVNVSVAENGVEVNKKFVERSYNDPVLTRAVPTSKDNVKALFPMSTEKSEYASSVLSDNQQPEVLEMHQLEAELESELQKLPWCAMEASSSEGRTGVFEAGALAKGEPSEDFENSDSYQYNGVMAGELNQKLCHLLVEQQESQIMELETELHHAHSKLHQKEAELQALKDCVKRLTEFSLVNASGSDEEGEDQGEELKTIITDGLEEKLRSECTKSTVGMKRSIGYESYICSEK